MPTKSEKMNALALPRCMRTEPKPEPIIVPIAGTVLIRLSFRSAFAVVSQLYFSISRGVQAFMYCPDWDAIWARAKIATNTKIFALLGAPILTEALIAVRPLNWLTYNSSLKAC